MRFALVGGVGYAVNLVVYDGLTRVAGVHYALAATAAFTVAVVNNYLWNRTWTFRVFRGSPLGQGTRFLVVSLAGLAVDLVVLRLLVRSGVAATPAQAVAVVVAMPVTFLGSKLWSFRPEPTFTAEPVYVIPPDLTSPRAVVCLPTYDERENLEPMIRALLSVLGPRDVVLVVDDDSPDGTGELADAIALRSPSVGVMHRTGKSGLGRAYLDAFRYALDIGAELVVQMDCDFSHDPNDVPRLINAAADADLVVGSRYVAGGSADGLTAARRVLSRGGCAYARLVLGAPVRDLTGGFKCHRRASIERIDLDRISSSGYGFQIETSFRELEQGARVAEIPIHFRERAEGASKMTGAIAFEALLKVLQLRVESVAARLARYGWIVRWWALSRGIVFVSVLAVQALRWPRPSWYPPIMSRPLALLGAWDGRWYSIVANRGYLVVPGRQSDTAFFPFYPVVLRLLHDCGLSYLAAGVLIGNLSFLVALAALYELTSSWTDGPTARRTVVYTALFPFGFVFSMVYPEAVVLAAVALAGVFAVRNRWTACAVTLICATLARPEGVFFALPVAAIALSRWQSLDRRDRGRALAAFAAGPAALAAILVYLREVVGDPLAFERAQREWGRWSSPNGIVRAVHELWLAVSDGREWLYRDAAFCLIYLGCLTLALRAGVPKSWLVAGALIVLLPLWSGTFTSDARFGLLALPVYCGIAYLARRPWLDRIMRVGSGALLAAGSATILVHWP